MRLGNQFTIMYSTAAVSSNEIHSSAVVKPRRSPNNACSQCARGSPDAPGCAAWYLGSRKISGAAASQMMGFTSFFANFVQIAVLMAS